MTPVLACLAPCGAAVAQRADENAVTAADDAFGTSIGLQNVGLYSAADARGFSPQQAGNLRIEGLYFDQETWNAGDCMVRETTIRIGVAAQSYSFPAPTGIADFSLRTPGDRAVASAVLTRGPFDGASASLETQIPLLEHRLAVDLCAGYSRNFDIDMFHRAHATSFGTTFRWQPAADTVITPFWSFVGGGARQIVPAVYTDGTSAPPPFQTRALGTQDGSTLAWHQMTFGAVAKSRIADQWDFAGGLFHSRERDPANDQPYLTLEGAQNADSVLDVSPPFRADSTSGELRLSRAFLDGVHRHLLEFSVRGRSVERSFGGDVLDDFGIISLASQAQFPRPVAAFGPQSHDSTRELDVGLTYEERWEGAGSIAAGILRDHYERRVDGATAPVDDRTQPRLLNLRAQTAASHGLAAYGSFVQGLEDSALAPVSAANRNEPPPATRTWQIDGGLRYADGQRFKALLGAFDIHKPYFNSDAANVYTQLGRVEHHGIETSWSYGDAGLTFLAGAVLLKSSVQRQIPEPGATGAVPLGPVPLTITANGDFAPPRWGPWAASLQWNRLSARVATTDNRLYLPPLSSLGAGLRYHWARADHGWTARLDAANLTNERGLHVSSLDVILPDQGRRYTLTLAADY